MSSAGPKFRLEKLTSHISPSDSTYSDREIQYIRDRTLLFNSLTSQNNFQRLNIQKCLDICQRSFDVFLESKEAQILKDTFINNGLNAQLGYNQGSDVLSIYFPLPTPEELALPLQSESQAIIWCMLGLLHNQYFLETDYLEAVQKKNLQGPFSSDDDPKQSRNTDNRGVRSGFSLSSALKIDKHLYTQAVNKMMIRDKPAPVLLANRCIHIFSHLTHALVSDIRLDYTLKTVTLILKPSTRGLTAVKHAKSGAAPALNFLQHASMEDLLAANASLPSDSMVLALNQSTTASQSSSIVMAGLDQAEIDQAAAAGISADVNGNISLDVLSGAYFGSPLIFDDEGGNAYRYSPIYPLINGYDIRQHHYSSELVVVQRNMVTSLVIQVFWAYVTDTLRYYPSNQLVSQINQSLYDYFYTGLSSLQAYFTPLQPLNIYLYGTAGTGKSAFVRALSLGLQHVVNNVFEPDKRFDTVRIPLNQTTLEALSAMLLVRGISDWSIERIIEQTLCKSGVIILHLEENPPDHTLQDGLYRLLQRMCSTLTTRYPEYRHNIINIFTANYLPSPFIRNLCNTITIEPPAQDIQQTWVSDTLEDNISSNIVVVDRSTVAHLVARNKTADNYLQQLLNHLPYPQFAAHPLPPPYFLKDTPRSVSEVAASSLPFFSSSLYSLPHSSSDDSYLRFLVAMHIRTLLPFTPDLRKLETLKRSISFNILMHLYRNLPAVCAAIGLKQELVLLPRHLINLALHAHVTIREHRSLRSSPTSPTPTLLLVHFIPVDSIGRSIKFSLPPLSLVSQDQFFYYPDARITTEVYSVYTRRALSHSNPFTRAVAPPTPRYLDASALAKIHAVFSMWNCNYLKPAVVVLAGPPRNTQAAAQLLRYLMHSEYTYFSPQTPINHAANERITCKEDGSRFNSNITIADAHDDISNTTMRYLGPVLAAKRDDSALVCPRLAPAAFFHKTPYYEPPSVVVSENDPRPELREFFALAETETHKKMLFGDPDPSTGVLLKFLQQLNISSNNLPLPKELAPSTEEGEHYRHPHSPTTSPMCPVGVVFARCNGMGQFYLRDLIDAGESLTHVTNVKKDRIMFVMMVDSTEQQNADRGDTDNRYHNIQPQLVSRSHNIIICED